MYKVYLMLLVSVFSFVGIPSAQTIISFSSLIERNFTIDLSSEEEESEGSENEIKELEQKLIQHRNLIALVFSNKRSAIALQNHVNIYNSIVFEVSTPPPKQ